MFLTRKLGFDTEDVVGQMKTRFDAEDVVEQMKIIDQSVVLIRQKL